MSKMDDLRALREARYERTVAGGAGSGASAPRRTPRSPAKPAPTTAAAPAPPEGDAEMRLCGHRAISGRTCTREHGHAAKSHRYS